MSNRDWTEPYNGDNGLAPDGIDPDGWGDDDDSRDGRKTRGTSPTSWSWSGSHSAFFGADVIDHDEDWVSVVDLETFRRFKQSSDGVIVIRRIESTTVHHPSCPHVREDAFLEKLANGRLSYFWAPSMEHAKRRWQSARACRHPSDPLAGGFGGPEARATSAPRLAPRSGPTWLIEGPSQRSRAVRAHADFVLAFEPRTEAQSAFRLELRERLSRLVSRDDEVLHATFFGLKPANADVENLLLYNVDTSGQVFAGAARGIRFELSSRSLPSAPKPVTYLYRPVKRTAGFELWEIGNTVTALAHVAIPRPTDRAAVWWAARKAVGPAASGSYDGRFAVSVCLTPPHGVRVATVSLVKPVLDGAIAALQAHADRATLVAVSARLAAAINQSADEVADLLSDPSAAALGVVQRLIHLRGDGFQMCPEDDRCVAAEIVIAPASSSDAWGMQCEVFAVQPR